MRKNYIIAIIIILVLALAIPALAATGTPAQNQDTTRPALTTEQSKEIANLHQQMMELRKQIIDKNVAYGRLTPEQGKQIKERITARQKFLQENPDWSSNRPYCCGGIRNGKGRGQF
ncbi:MAG TPA: hypothetical protein DD719_05500 [Desulfotomaculum sp.]|jgi:peptidoglycan hydrolase CwlO-like protein|nr:hypothetical protein [Desulfotomaculum sp.]HCJ79567.1 hypothetical protein [Desulfotomaculum sp.]